jgi:branched-subunit amino acid aminotransferase/4-amino-4-deoxychorismate lyase
MAFEAAPNPAADNPIKIMACQDHVRAVPGDTGEAKTPGNYAASLLAGQKAKDRGYSQVLWLDGIEHKIKYGAQEITINDMKVGPLTDRFFRAITDIQYGKAEDPKGWIEPV